MTKEQCYSAIYHLREVFWVFLIMWMMNLSKAARVRAEEPLRCDPDNARVAAEWIQSTEIALHYCAFVEHKGWGQWGAV